MGLATLAGAAHLAAQPGDRPLDPLTVTEVVDGRSFMLGARVAVRLWGVDTPRLDDPGGAEAKGALIDILKRGDFRVHCVDLSRTAEGVIVARCASPSGSDLGAALISSGRARDCPRESGGFYKGLEPGDPAFPATPACTWLVADRGDKL